MRICKKPGLRALAVLLTFCLIFAAVPAQPALAATSFSDVPASAWYRADVLALVDKGVIQGTGSNRFSPESRLSRGAFVTMLCKTVLTPAEINRYAFKGSFEDVSQEHWANPYVNWAAENGIVKGRGDGTFGPDDPVSRQDMAVMVVNFAKVTDRQMPAVNAAISFTDRGKISYYASASVTACQRAGVINGYTDRTFRPTQTASRAEAASMYARFLNKCTHVRYEIIRKKVNNIAVQAVEFDPREFTPAIVLGQDRVNGREGAGSLVSRTKAVIAVNAAFFYMDSYFPIGTMIHDGRVLFEDNLFAPAKSAFVIDNNGNCSVQNFATYHRAALHPKDGGKEIALEDVGLNQKPMVAQDPTPIIFTKDYGAKLAFTAKDAIVVDANGVITKMAHDVNLDVPSTGFILARRARKATADAFFNTAKVGDRLDVQRTYKGATTQDIRLSIGLGPCIVKNGAPYGNTDTYKAEGFKDPGITVYSARRACIGIKSDGKLVLVTADTTLANLSKIMISLGCKDAINCDGGGSTNLYVDGQWLYGPQERKLNNMLVFK